MRKIKFRLWDTEEKCFMNHSRVIESRVLALENNGEGRFIFQQWTGLLDGRGREIYEGDIISGVTKQNLEVVFQQGSFGMNVMMRVSFHKDERKPFFTTLNCYESDDLEVIGNIYENPELLEETK